MAGRREEKKQAVRQAIYDAALRLIERDGYDAVSVTDITRDVGIAKGTFFNHFPAKADILAAWYETLIADYLAAQSPQDDLVDSLLELTMGIGRLTRQYPEMWRAKNIEAARSQSLRDVEQDTDRQVAARIADLLRRSALPEQAPGPEHLADLILALATGTWREAMVTEQLDTAPDRMRQRLQTLLGTIGACQA
ncbi:TetR/AcrR family transcriptional regulator [Maricaulis sp.]|uniref:TetR/AcrR family transcriptional regulator n=1 Tax=Maricaulis sp. TaxID=1486257 RepID=UPI00261AB069|nr:TetR/AcrR family transcriptional regulator [Maricaulis sp.]